MKKGTQTKRILVVDDDWGILEPVVILLESALYRVDSSVDGESALARMERSLPDLLILDGSMPGASGFAICEQLKKNPRVQHIPIIIMSARNDVQVLADQAGADDYVSKPFNIEELLYKISNLLQPAEALVA